VAVDSLLRACRQRFVWIHDLILAVVPASRSRPTSLRGKIALFNVTSSRYENLRRQFSKLPQKQAQTNQARHMKAGIRGRHQGCDCQLQGSSCICGVSVTAFAYRYIGAEQGSSLRSQVGKRTVTSHQSGNINAARKNAISPQMTCPLQQCNCLTGGSV
jgi:hypothetical protein